MKFAPYFYFTHVEQKPNIYRTREAEILKNAPPTPISPLFYPRNQPYLPLLLYNLQDQKYPLTTNDRIKRARSARSAKININTKSRSKERIDTTIGAYSKKSSWGPENSQKWDGCTINFWLYFQCRTMHILRLIHIC